MSRVPALVLVLPAILVLTACASSGEPASPQKVSLADALTTSAEYGRTSRCLSVLDYDVVRVVDDQHLLFSDTHGTEVWVNTLRSPCTGLRPGNRLHFDMSGQRLCSTDTATIVQQLVIGPRAGPACSLGEFHEITVLQSSALSGRR